MQQIKKEMKKIKEKANKLSENYENFQIIPENFDFPFVYLTDDEIIKYNQEFKRTHSKIQAVILSDFMNLKLNKEVDHSVESNMNLLTNSYKKSIKDILDEEEEEEKERSFIEEKNNNEKSNYSSSNNNSKGKKQNKYINKKRKRKSGYSVKKANKVNQNKNKEKEKSIISYNIINDDDD